MKTHEDTYTGGERGRAEKGNGGEDERGNGEREEEEETNVVEGGTPRLISGRGAPRSVDLQSVDVSSIFRPRFSGVFGGFRGFRKVSGAFWGPRGSPEAPQRLPEVPGTVAAAGPPSWPPRKGKNIVKS